MESVKEILLISCTCFIVCEVIYYITPEDKVVKWIYGLVYSVIILSAIINISSISFSNYFYDDYISSNTSLDNSIFVPAAEKELCSDIEEALAVAGIDSAKTEVVLSIDDENVIQVERIEVKLKYQSDYQRAKVIIDNLFMGVDNVEVLVDG